MSTFQDHVISPRGDATLTFANRSGSDAPTLRFRVSSYMLSESSPLFAHVFARRPTGRQESLRSRGNGNLGGDEGHNGTTIVADCDVEEYLMPQKESNEHEAMVILLHAAHMHNDMVPRDITFDQFIAIAEACRKYKCTSPLEIFVECKWLPHWMPRATEDMPLGFLFISYVFGLRRLFTRMSKTVILNIQDREDFTQQCGTSSAMTWPQELVDKIWAVRSAKVDQVYACCRELLQEYLPAPTSPRGRLVTEQNRDSVANTSRSTSANEERTTRCPKGSKACDAMNLGWLILSFNELGLMHQVDPFLASLRGVTAEKVAPARSLGELLDALRFMPSTPGQIHDGPVCDYQNAFRSALNDVFNSISGLTLYDISGKEHGWSLSKQKANLPQRVFRLEKSPSPSSSFRKQPSAFTTLHVVSDSLGLVRASGNSATDVFSAPHAELLLRIFQSLDSVRDIRALAMINKATYNIYKAHLLELAEQPSADERTGRRVHRQDRSANNNGHNHLDVLGPSSANDTIVYRRQRSNDSMTIHRINSSLSGYRSPPAPAKLDRATATAGSVPSASRETVRTAGGVHATMEGVVQREVDEGDGDLSFRKKKDPSLSSNSTELNEYNEGEISGQPPPTRSSSVTISSPEESEVQKPQEKDKSTSSTAEVERNTSNASASPATRQESPSLGAINSLADIPIQADAMKSITREGHSNEKFLKADLLRARKPEDKSLSGKDDKVSRTTFGQIIHIRASNENNADE